MLIKKMVLQEISTLVLAILIIASFVFSSVTVIRAENEKNRAEAGKEAMARMRRGFESFESSIDISDLEIAPCELGKLFSDVIKDTPYLFYVSNNLTYSYRAGGCVVEVKPEYTMEKEDAKAALEYCKREVKKMAKLLENRESELERLIFAHDLICQKFSYDLSLESNNMYSFLKSGKGTCQGYTWTYMALLRELGIECGYVASDAIQHIWLWVKIDGVYYHSDVTWDDPLGAENDIEYRRRHLLFSDAKADQDGYIERYCAKEIKCDEKRYDQGISLSHIAFCSLAGDVDHDGIIKLYDLLFFRLYLSGEEILTRNICMLCADLDGNLLIDGNDVRCMRDILLNIDY